MQPKHTHESTNMSAGWLVVTNYTSQLQNLI